MDDEMKKRLQMFGGGGQNNQKPKGGGGGYVPMNSGGGEGPGKTREEDHKYKRQDDRGDAKRYRTWNAILRIGALGTSVWGMYISAQFSVDGFRFQIDDRAWIGWGLSVIIIVLESVWQKFGDNMTLALIAIACYAYGITTNVLGILGNRGGYDGNPASLIVPIGFGLLLEIFPEPVMAWAISGDTTSDPIRKLFERLS